MNNISRRNFLRTSVMGGFAVTFAAPSNIYAPASQQSQGNVVRSSVGLTTGNNRADMAFRALVPYSKQIRQAIGNRRVILKPNNVSIDIPLCATHVDTLEGILEFLKSIKKLDNVVIAESAANGPTFDGFSNYNYFSLAKKYPVRFVDLDQEKSQILYVFDEKDFRPHPVRFSSVLLSPDSYIVSVARMKTHDRAIATLSLKNIIFGAPVKDQGFTFGRNRKEGSRSDKAIVHGSGFRGINYNLYDVSSRLHPHLAVIDGFEGMEGNGPNNGTPVDHRVCVASTDWLAADRVGIELMGIDYTTVAWLSYCAQAGRGTADLNNIEIIGEKISDHIKHYKLSDNIDKQLILKNPGV
ncbi:MAG TPA: DUF362 domain-containing protein [Bacteroidales bacterium]|jgi:uncharacterized protein (DUF362 family)|nr:DUF362 domain-containing protein [Bacteroidales bacterium]